jgi:hypothetical protein
MVQILFSVRYELVPYKHDLDEFWFFKGRVMVQTVSHRHLNAEARDRFQVISYGIFDGQSHTGTGFFSSTSGFSTSCRYNNAPCLSLFTSCSYQKDNQAKPGNLPDSLHFKGLKIVRIFY